MLLNALELQAQSAIVNLIRQLASIFPEEYSANGSTRNLSRRSPPL
jgi:hypothetical protein